MQDHHQGGCLCGKVTFETDAPLRDVVFCHCSQCRKQTGLYYAATSVRESALRIRDDGALRWFAASDFAKRGFCGTCGTALFWKAGASDQIAIMAGAFDEGTPLTAACHIFCEGRGSYYSIADGLPQYPRGTPGLIVDGN